MLGLLIGILFSYNTVAQLEQRFAIFFSKVTGTVEAGSSAISHGATSQLLNKTRPESASRMHIYNDSIKSTKANAIKE